MSEFHDDYPQYELMAHHSEETGVAIRKKLWRVFFIMLAITIVELIVGFKSHAWGIPYGFLKVLFISLTLLKAYYIIYEFMHLGGEVRLLKWLVIAPFTLFVSYLTFWTAIDEGAFVSKHKQQMDPIYKMQKEHQVEHQGGKSEHGGE